MSSITQKFCPLLSQGPDVVYCKKECAWYCDDGIPAMCMIKDISFALSRIEKKLKDIYIALPDEEF